VRAAWVYVGLGLALWVALHEAAVSPTLAGVAAGFLTPARSFQRPAAVSAEAKRIADLTVDEPEPPDVDAPEWLQLAALSREAVPVLARAERAILPWATWFVLPAFALANAGVWLRGGALGDALTHPIAIGLLLARLIGPRV
jgi:NhaA family Na+:H+ antiporter